MSDYDSEVRREAEINTPPSPDDLAKAIERIENELLIATLEDICQFKIDIKTLLDAAKRLKEVERDLEEYRNIVVDCSKEINSIRQSSREKDEFIEKLVKNGEALSAGIWSCCADGEHSPERNYCIPGKQFKEALQLAYSKGYGKKI